MQEGVMDADKRRHAKPDEMTTARVDQLRSECITAKRNRSLHANRTINQPHFPNFHPELWTRYANRC